MLTLLEEAPQKFRKQINKFVQMTELTRFSLLINRNIFIIGTNKKLLILEKKLLGMRHHTYKWTEIKELTLNKSTSQVIISSSNDKKLQLKFENDKASEVEQLVKRTNELIGGYDGSAKAKNN